MGDTEFKLGDKVSIFMDGNQIVALNVDTGHTLVMNVSETYSNYLKSVIEKILNNKREKIKFSEDMAIWCNGTVEFNELMKNLDDMGYTWISGFKMSDLCPIETGLIRIILNKHKKVKFRGDKEHRDENHKYVDFSDVDFSDCIPDIKVGDIVEVVNPCSAYTTYSSFFKETDISR